MSDYADKMTDALAALMEGFTKLVEEIKEEHDIGDDNDEELNAAVDADIDSNFRVVIEGVMDSDDYSSEEIASMVAHLTESLQEIDPDVFDVDEEDEYDSSHDDDDEEDEDMEDFDEFDDEMEYDEL